MVFYFNTNVNVRYLNREISPRSWAKDKIIEVSTQQAAIEYARECGKEYYLIWNANAVPIRSLYFINRLQKIFTYSGLGSVLVKTSIMREIINSSDNPPTLEQYQKYVAEHHSEICVEKSLQIMPNASAVFGRQLSTDEMRRLPFDVIIQ